MDDEQQKLIDKITKEWADKGMIIEGGWQAFLSLGIPKGAPDQQKVEMRKAYYLGAQHLWVSIINILDPGMEPTERDLRRMDMINEELKRFTDGLASLKQV